MIVKRLSFVIVSFILVISCKNDSSRKHMPDENKSLEEIYFEDYSSPQEKWTFIDQDGNEMFEAIYDNIRDLNKGVAPANLNGRWGLINSRNKQIYPFQFKEMSSCDDGSFLAKDFKNIYLHISNQGQLNDTLSFEELYPFKNGKARFKRDELWGIIDMNGDAIINAKYHGIKDFNQGHFLASIHSRQILLDKTGKLRHEADWIEWIDANHIVSSINNQISLIKLKLNNRHSYLLKNCEEILYNGTDIYFIKDDKSKFYSIESKSISPTKRNILEPLGNGFWSYLENCKVGIVNQDDVVLVEAIYDIIYPFASKKAVISIDDQWGFIDISGKELIEPSLPLAWSFNNELARVFTRKGVGFIDTLGRLRIDGNLQYLEIKNFKEGFARAQKR